jgi:superfamily II DNA or RNA helicase
MTETVTIASNAVTAKLHEPSREVKLLVQSILSYQVDGAEHSLRFKSGGWDGRSSFLDFKAGTFPAGFVLYLAAALRRKGYTVNTVRKPLPVPLGPEKPKVDDFPEDPRYDYQPEVVNRLVKHGQIIAQVATGGGKSRIAKLAFARINRPAMFLTTRGILMYQMHDAFERDLGIKPSILGDGQFGHTVMQDGVQRQAVKKMSVAMVQTLVARLEEKTVDAEVERWMDARSTRELKQTRALKDKLVRAKRPWAEVDAAVKALDEKLEKERPSLPQLRAELAVKVDEHMRARAQTIKLLGMFELVILEEAHESSGNSYYEILRHCKNAHYRLALTATPFMKDSEESNMRLMACSGPVGIRISEKLLIDRGILARPYFKYVTLSERPDKLYKSTAWSSAYRIGIVENEARNRAAVRECVRMASYGLTSMVLVQQVAHGDIVEAMARAAGLRTEFIRGEDDNVGRKAALARLAAGDIDVLIGTNILDVGVDVPAVGHVCLLGGGKAEVALRQRIGRGLRAKKTGPNVCFVTDFADDFNYHLRAHAQQRRAIVEGTEGFNENILKPGQDFDFAGLGFVAPTLKAA